MKLDRQLEVLINDAAKYGVAPEAVEKALAPVIKLFAQQLQHTKYYVLQNLEQDWVLTTITNSQSQQVKKVIYAFVSVQDAAGFQKQAKSDLIAMPIDIVQLLFRLFSLQQVDSIIFLENSPNLDRGVEIEREHLARSIEQQIQQLRIPPNLA